MPRGRMLNKSISLNLEVANSGVTPALLYTWVIPHLDCEGKIHANPHLIKGLVFPYFKEFTIEVIEECIQKLAQTSLVVLYGDTQRFMKFTGFENQQNINKDKESPSRIPDPTPELLQSYSALSKVKISKDNSNIARKETLAHTPTYKQLLNKNIFKKPSVGEVEAYCKERANDVDPHKFCDFYEAKGWMVGKNKMKDWQACVRTWEREHGRPKKSKYIPL